MGGVDQLVVPRDAVILKAEIGKYLPPTFYLTEVAMEETINGVQSQGVQVCAPIY